jgi:hypothetical protein
VALLQPGDASARAGNAGVDETGADEDAAEAVPVVAAEGADPPEVQPAPVSNPAVTQAITADFFTRPERMPAV